MAQNVKTSHKSVTKKGMGRNLGISGHKPKRKKVVHKKTK